MGDSEPNEVTPPPVNESSPAKPSAALQAPQASSQQSIVEPKPTSKPDDKKPLKYSVPLYKSLQNIIVNQNKYLQILLAEEQFKSTCEEHLHADFFGQDLS